jgi:hypothetical protein
MRKLFLIQLVFLAITATANAQPMVEASAYAVRPDNNVNAQQQFGYGLAGGLRFKQLYLGVDVFGDPAKTNPKQLTRGRAFATWSLYEYEGVKFTAGGGGWKTGAEVGGFGQLGAEYKKLAVWGRYGNQSFAEAEGYYRILNLERMAAGPFYRFTRLNNQPQLHQAGLRLTLR